MLNYKDTYDRRIEEGNLIPLRLHEFSLLSKFITKNYGIKLPESKTVLLQNRLQKNIKQLNLSSFEQYVNYLLSDYAKAEDLQSMVDAITTNKTDFFRELHHFTFLETEGLRSYLDQTHIRNLNIWSAGSSSGEEAYSIAITLQEFSNNQNKIDFQILATDISFSMLEKAEKAIFDDQSIAEIPIPIKHKYFQKGKNEYQNKARVVNEIRKKVNFSYLNLIQINEMPNKNFDIIFCRNTLIYFDRETQYNILNQLCKRLNYGGYLFLGHSESIIGLDLPLLHIRPTIYRKI